MKRTISIGWGKLWVGGILIFALIAMLYASFTGGGTSIFDTKKTFSAYFRNVNGLLAGSPVWMSGVEVGNVKKVEFVNLDSNRQVMVSCRVKETVWPMLTPGCAVQLGTIGFLGDRYVEIVPGPGGIPPIDEGAVVPTLDIGSAPAMFKAGEAALGRAGDVVGNIDSLLSRINRGEGMLGKLARDSMLHDETVRLLARLSSLTAELQVSQKRIVASIEEMSRSVGDISRDVAESKGTIGKLVNDSSLYTNLAQATARLDTLVTKVNGREGSLGLMVNDTVMYSEMASLLARMNNLMAAIEKDPRKYLKFSVF